MDLESRRKEKKGVGRKGKGAAKRLLVGAGARILFYPTLLYNVVRSKIQPLHFRWWDEVNQDLLLGAVPFPKDIPKLKELGVSGVITLNEPFETLVSPSLYQELGIDHLVLPTRDYMYAPSLVDINKALDFIHKMHFLEEKLMFIAKPVGEGAPLLQSAIWLWDLMQVKQEHMTPDTALEMIRTKRARVLLTSSQMQVQWMLLPKVKTTQTVPVPFVVNWNCPQQQLILKDKTGRCFREWK